MNNQRLNFRKISVKRVSISNDSDDGAAPINYGIFRPVLQPFWHPEVRRYDLALLFDVHSPSCVWQVPVFSFIPLEYLEGPS